MSATPSLPFASLPIVITGDNGAEQARCTLGEFMHDNAAELSRYRKTLARNIANGIRLDGVYVINLGASGIFRLTAQDSRATLATPASKWFGICVAFPSLAH
jgi:hypothetical protein